MTEPLSPETCDVRGMEWMPLHGRLFGSRFYSLALRDPRAGLAGLKLWWEAWQQCPAGSLPNDDFDLARMADFGSDLRGWKKVRLVALHGFIECSDDRLYHPLICAEAKDAWERRRKDRERKAQQRAKRWTVNGHDDGNTEGSPEDVPRDNDGTDDGQGEGSPKSFRSDRTGQDRTRKKELSLPSDAEPACIAPGGTEAPPDQPPSWPPPPLATASTAVVGSVVANLTGRRRGAEIAAPARPVRSVDEQISAVGGGRTPPGGKPIAAESLAEIRRLAGIGGGS